MEKALYFLYKCTCLLMILSSMSAWFLWDVHIGLVYILSILIWILFYSSMRNKHDVHLNSFFLLPVSCLFLADLIKAENIIPIKTTLLCIVIIQLLSFNDYQRKDILKFCGVGFAIILLVSLVGFLLSWVIPMPCYGYLYYEDNYVYENYLFFLKMASLLRGFRFTSVFLEPGHVGMICAFFLYAFKYEIKKWYVLVYLVSLICTLSLAGYLLLIIGFGFYGLNKKGSDMFKWLFLGVLMSVVGYVVAIHYNGGDNIVNSMIVERLEYDEEEGIVGNNRTDEATSQRFKSIIGTDVFWFGYSIDDYEKLRGSDIIHGSGYKIEIMSRGILGVGLIFLFYFLLARKSRNKKFMLLMFLLYVICFIQRAYPLWVAWLLPFICSMEIDKKYKRIEQKLQV